ncbi:MAG: hypothetical protein QOE51_181 [Actinoplanes sp.]|jgi:riboflavin biosynthesis pyrimidine reductase|nr:hypothetical protein [Actinoplanes sp.]
MDEATARELLAQLVADGRLNPGDTVSVPGGGDARADFRVDQSDGATLFVQLKTIRTETTTYTMRTVDVAESARPLPVLLPNRLHSPRTVSISAESLLRVIATLLPGPARHRYLEEWRGELYDLDAEGTPWWRQAGHVVGVVLCAAPVMAVTLRLRRTRVVDQ